MNQAVAVAIWLVANSVLAQVPFDDVVADLSSKDAGKRLKAVQALRGANYPEAAVPLAPLIADERDAIQLEAIGAELNFFLAEKIPPPKRLGYVVELRNTSVSAEAVFSGGRLALASENAPSVVLTALRQAIRDDNPRVGLEALYAFGALASGPAGNERQEILRTSGPDLVAQVGARDPAFRFGALRVLGQLFARRAGDEPIEQTVGDGVIAAMNDRDGVIRSLAFQTIGAMRIDRAVVALNDLVAVRAKGVEAEAALDALARIATPSSAPTFTTQLTAKSAALRGIAIEGLARIGPRDRLSAIQTAVTGERAEGVVLAAAFADTLLGGAGIDPIVAALSKPRLRDQARGYLVELAPGRSALFSAHTQNPDVRVRTDIVGALALSDDRAALPLLEPLVQDKEPAIARLARVAVDRLRALPSVP